MSATGPDRDNAYHQGNKATDAILVFLKNSYGAEKPHSELFLGKKLGKKWDELEIKLRETICEMIWIDHQASW